MRSFRSVFISDIHLGGGRCEAYRLLAALDQIESDRLYLLGDIIDLEAIARGSRWRAQDTQVLLSLIARATDEHRVTYVPGNHDAPLRLLAGQSIAGVDIEMELAYQCVDGSRLLMFHGDAVDGEISAGGWQRIGTRLHVTIGGLEHALNRIGRRMGRRHRPVMIGLKQWIGPARRYVQQYETQAVRYAAQRGFSGCICGHIHYGHLFDANGYRYLNDGDWVEHLTFLGERHDGVWELWRCDGKLARVQSLAPIDRQRRAPQSAGKRPVYPTPALRAP